MGENDFGQIVIKCHCSRFLRSCDNIAGARRAAGRVFVEALSDTVGALIRRRPRPGLRLVANEVVFCEAVLIWILNGARAAGRSMVTQ